MLDEMFSDSTIFKIHQKSGSTKAVDYLNSKFINSLDAKRKNEYKENLLMYFSWNKIKTEEYINKISKLNIDLFTDAENEEQLINKSTFNKALESSVNNKFLLYHLLKYSNKNNIPRPYSILQSILASGSSDKKIYLLENIYFPKSQSLSENISIMEKGLIEETEYDKLLYHNNVTKEYLFALKVFKYLQIRKGYEDLFSNNYQEDINNEKNLKETSLKSLDTGFNDVKYHLLRINLNLLKMFTFEKTRVNNLAMSNLQTLLTQTHLIILEKI